MFLVFESFGKIKFPEVIEEEMLNEWHLVRAFKVMMSPPAFSRKNRIAKLPHALLCSAV